MSSFLLQVDPNSFYTNNIVLIMGILMIASLGAWLYFLKKKNPNMDLGPLIATAMTDKHETFFMSLIFLEYVATSLIAATVHNPGMSHGIEMSPLGRVLAHISLSVTGTICQFVLATDIGIMFVKGQPIGNRIGNFFTMLMVGFLAFYIPYLNLTLIASGTGESLAFQTWWYSVSPFTSEAQLQAFYLKMGLPPDYQPWGNLSTVVQVCIATAGVIHYGLTPIEGLRTISSSKRRGLLMQRVYKDLEKDDDKKDDKKEDKKGGADKDDKKKADPKEIIPNIEFLLRRIGYTEATKIKHLAEAGNRTIVGNGSEEAKSAAMKLGHKLANLVIRAKIIDSSDTPGKPDEKKKLIEDIRAFFTNKPTAASDSDKGLGLTIKK